MKQHQVRVRTPLSVEEIDRQLAALKVEISDLREFYLLTNGLDKEWFQIFPLVDAANIKKTWESLSRANTLGETPYLRNHPELLERFLVFASISGGNCAVLDRTDQSIWFQEDGLHQTDFSLYEFIETELREVAEL
jgi:hypothetical protein